MKMEGMSLIVSEQARGLFGTLLLKHLSKIRLNHRRGYLSW